jgi:hypothetical protein
LQVNLLLDTAGLSVQLAANIADKGCNLDSVCYNKLEAFGQFAAKIG